MQLADSAGEIHIPIFEYRDKLSLSPIKWGSIPSLVSIFPELIASIEAIEAVISTDFYGSKILRKRL